jgi:hypothetical protein
MRTKIERIHRQLSSAWRRSWQHSHKAFRPAIDPCHSREDADKILPSAEHIAVPQRTMDAGARRDDDEFRERSNNVLVSSLPLPKSSGLQAMKVTVEPKSVLAVNNDMGLPQPLERDQ